MILSRRLCIKIAEYIHKTVTPTSSVTLITVRSGLGIVTINQQSINCRS